MTDTITIKHVIQLGIVVPDAGKAAANFVKLFGIDPDTVVDMDSTTDDLTDTMYYGKDISFSLGIRLVNYAGIQFEFISPKSGDANPYSDFLKEKGPGIHHINVFYENYEEANKVYAKLGTPMLIEGLVMGSRFEYRDLLAEMGLVVETAPDITEDYIATITG